MMARATIFCTELLLPFPPTPLLWQVLLPFSSACMDLRFECLDRMLENILLPSLPRPLPHQPQILQHLIGTLRLW